MSLIKRIFGNLPNGKDLVLPVITAVGVGLYSLVTPVFGQTTEKNLIYSGLEKNKKIELTLTPNSKVNLTEFLKISVKKGKPSYDIIPTEEAVKNINSYLGARGIFCRDCGNDSMSVNRLDEAVKDGKIDENDSFFVGKRKIEKGIYTFMVRSPTITDSKCGNVYTGEGIPIFVSIKPYGEIKQRPAEHYQEDTTNKQGKDLTKTQLKHKHKKHPELKLIAGGFAGDDFNGGQVGVQYGPVALLMNYSQAKDRLVREVTAPLSNGRSGYGREDETNLSALGPLAEIHAGHFFAGVGTNFWNYDLKTLEQIKSENGDVIKQDTNSKTEHEMSTMGYAGAEIPLGDGFSLRILGGGDDRNGAFGGAGFSYSLTHNKDKK